MMISVEEADQLIAEALADFGTRQVSLQNALGAVLRETVVAERDQPPFDRVTMDGVALAFAALESGSREFRVQAVQAAGDPPQTLRDAGHCIEIMTGAVLPAGCDCVIPVEDLELNDGVARLGADARPGPAQYIHARGSDHRRSSELLAPGTILGGPEIAVLASAGKAQARVARTPRAAVVSTGNELVEVGVPIEPHQVRRSNAHAALAMLRQTLGRVSDGQLVECHLPDRPGSLQDTLGALLEDREVLILSGGVSRGRFDYVPEALEELGVERVFHRVAQRPGKPMWFGTGPRGQLVFGLPGNPVSTLVCLRRFVLPALLEAMGAAPGRTPLVALAEGFEFAPDLTAFVPALIDHDAGGDRGVRLEPTNTSGDLTALAGTDGFVELPRGCASFAPGFGARFYRWRLP